VIQRNRRCEFELTPVVLGHSNAHRASDWNLPVEEFFGFAQVPVIFHPKQTSRSVGQSLPAFRRVRWLQTVAVEINATG
jgi:hypothetical protein